jgi:RecJ-like exonuclease
MSYSNCCGATVYEDTDICSDCKEHCAIMDACEDCDGTGEVDEIDQSKVNSQTITPPYHKVKCLNCDGTGEVEVFI